MFRWNILKEKKYKGYPYENILKIIGNNQVIMINYENNLIEFNVRKYNHQDLNKYIILDTVKYDVRTHIRNLSLKFTIKKKKY